MLPQKITLKLSALLLSLLTISGAAYWAYLFIFTTPESIQFPILSPGIYSGFISPPASQNKQSPFLLIRSQDNETLFLIAGLQDDQHEVIKIAISDLNVGKSNSWKKL